MRMQILQVENPVVRTVQMLESNPDFRSAQIWRAVPSNIYLILYETERGKLLEAVEPRQVLSWSKILRELGFEIEGKLDKHIVRKGDKVYFVIGDGMTVMDIVHEFRTESGHVVARGTFFLLWKIERL